MLQSVTVARRQAGFTLMELMIVVAIVAILAAIALPAYQNSVTKTWRNKAAACVTEMAQRMERRFTGNMTYEGPTGAADQLPPNSCTTEDGMAQYYAFSFTVDPTATAFTLQAVPQGSQAARDGQCGTLTIDQSGNRTASGTGPVELCW
ncbi:MAG: type IV pilin protein [Chromatocurvus sp.]